jgi:hypothetical protein
LSKGLDREPLPYDEPRVPPPCLHENVRGATYYN